MEKMDRATVRDRFRARREEKKRAKIQAREDACWDVVVTCHKDYLGQFLNECLVAWDRERVPGKRILVLDDCGFAPCLVGLTCPGWEVVSGKWGNPSGPRNAGLEKVTAPWVVHWDADNVPRRGLGRAFTRATSDAGEKVAYIGTSVPDGDPRDCYGVDTNSLWRTEAIRSVGGWVGSWVEDWRLGWRLAAEGWQIQQLAGEPIERRLHGNNRTYGSTEDEKLWTSREFAIVSLHRGDWDLSQRWLDSLAKQELPPNCNITLICDTTAHAFLEKLRLSVQQLQRGKVRARMTGVFSISGASIEDVNGRRARHSRVFDLYQMAMQVTPEPWFYTWEDDVFPTDPRTLRNMNALLRPGPKCRVGVVGATYAERYRPNHVCASRSADAWQGDILLRDVTKARRVGSTAAGLTLWRRSDWESMSDQSDSAIGWDFSMNRAALARGAESWLVPDLCEHATGENVAEVPQIDLPPVVKPKAIDRKVANMFQNSPLKNQLLFLVLPALVNQLIRVLDEDKLKALLGDLITKLEQAVIASPSKVDDATVLPIAKHLRSFLD